MSRTTPMTSRGRSSGTRSRVTCFPMGFSLGQKVRAMVWLMIVTHGAEANVSSSCNKYNNLRVGSLFAHFTAKETTNMLTKLGALGAMMVLIGCGTKSADNPMSTADVQKPAASAPAGFDNTKIAPEVRVPAGTRFRVRLDQALDMRCIADWSKYS